MEFNSNAEFLATRPPKVEDAGLENCALPIHAIQEAFKRAASAVHSTAASLRRISETDGGIFTQNSGPSNEKWEDACIDTIGSQGLGQKQSCVDTLTGGLLEEGHDKVVDIDGQKMVDELVEGKEADPKLGDKPCVEGLSGAVDESPGSPERNEDEPTLTGTYL